MAVLSAVTVLPPAAGLAEPPRSLREAKAEVAVLQHRAEVAAEQYNTARVMLERVQERLHILRARVDHRRVEVSRLQAALGDMAAETYRSGGVGREMQLFFSVQNPRDLLRAATALQQVSRQQALLLRSAHRAQRSLATDQSRLVAQQARRAQISGALADNKAEVETQLDKAQQVLDSLEAEQRARLEAQRRAAAREARQARAAREARQERAAQQTETRSPTPTPTPTHTSSDTSSGSGSGSGTTGGTTSPTPAQVAVDFAYDQLGEPYVWGAAGPDSWDCSGLTMQAWAAAGVSLPHSSSMQYSSGTKVSRSELRPGDLVFYYSPISHVAIYVGNGEIIHAPNSSEPVKVDPVGLMPYTGAVRP